MDFNIAIRTMIIEGNLATYSVGGGIVWDSDPLEEWQEAQQKSRIIDMYQDNFVQKNQSLKPVPIFK
jgi:anthranilate/para-aminobenzoate synthase component I